MKRTLIVMSSNRELEKPTKQTIAALSKLGAIRLFETGSSDVTFARNRALSATCNHLREFPDRDVVLMMDDDMVVPSEVAQRLADEARASGVACSAAYATATAYLAGCRWKKKPGRWLVGLGCVAIPRALLLELEARAEAFEVNGEVLHEFTWSSAEGGEWFSEDYRLCMNLGGVVLLPLGVGHVKKGEIWPDDLTLERIQNGEALSHDDSQKTVAEAT